MALASRERRSRSRWRGFTRCPRGDNGVPIGDGSRTLAYPALVRQVQLQVHGAGTSRLVALDGERFTVGKALGNDLVLDDASTSRLHLVLERTGPTWTATDAGSTNGTWINGKRLLASQALHDGDRLVVGVVTIVVAVPHPRSDTATAVLSPAPDVTPRERDLLAALCRPVLDGNVLTEPASVRAMAAELSVSESAIKKGLGRLYSKFELHGEDRRRGRLAIAAIRAGLAPAPAPVPRDEGNEPPSTRPVASTTPSRLPSAST